MKTFRNLLPTKNELSYFKVSFAMPAAISATGKKLKVEDMHAQYEFPKIIFLSAFYSKLRESESHSVVSDSLRLHGLYSPWNSPGQNTGVGSVSLLQGLFLTQEQNWDLLHCRWILYQLSCQGSYICADKQLCCSLSLDLKKSSFGSTNSHFPKQLFQYFQCICFICTSVFVNNICTLLLFDLPVLSISCFLPTVEGEH